MKKFLLNSMLVALCGIAGTGMALAETTNAAVKMTYVDGGNTEAAAGEVESATIGYLKISGGALTTANAGWGVNNIVYLQVDGSAAEGTISKVTLTGDFSDNTGKKRDAVVGVGYNASEWSADLTWDTADRSITTCGATQTLAKGGSSATFDFDITDAFKNDDDKVVTIIMYATNAAGINLDAVPTVVIETIDAATSASYTIKYVDEEGTEIKESRENVGTIDGAATIEDSDKANITVEGQKYIYKADDAEGMTIAADNSTVVTITFRKANVYTVHATSTVGGWSYDVQGVEGDDVKVNYPRYIVEGTTAYINSEINPEKNNIEYAKVVSAIAEDTNLEIAFAEFATDVVFFDEGENLYETEYTGAPSRTSMGKAGMIENEKVIATLAPATYKIYAATHCASKSGATITYNVSGIDEPILTQEPAGWLALEYEGKEFALTAEGALSLTTTQANSGLDYILIVKTGEAPDTPDTPATEASYTIKYVDEEGTEIKESRENVGTIDGAATIEDSDKENITVEGQKYIYKADDAEGMTIAADNSTVVTVTFRKANVYTVHATSSVGGWSYDVQGVEGDDVKVNYPRYIVEGTTAYINSEINPAKNNIEYAKVVSAIAEDTNLEIAFAEFATDVAFFNEGENIYDTEYTDAAVRTSMGKAGKIENDKVIATLAPATYKIYAATHCASKYGATITYNVSGLTDAILTQEPAGFLALEYLGTEFTLEAEGALSLNTTNSKSGLDYVLIVKTGETTAISDIMAEGAADTIYNVMGQRVNSNAKGVLIINGKKVLRK